MDKAIMKTNPGIKIALAALAFLLIAAASPFISVTVDSITGVLRGSSTNLFAANSNRLNSAVNLSSRVAKGGDTMTGTLAVPAITLNGTNITDLIGAGGGSYHSNIVSATITNTGNAVVGGNLDVTGSITVGGSNVADVAEAQIKSRWAFYREYEFLTQSSSRIQAMYPDVVGTSGGSLTSASQLTPVELNHPGVFRFTSGSSSNTGYYYLSGENIIQTGGGEFCSFIFRIPTTNATRATLGFFDYLPTPIDGMVIRTGSTLGNWNELVGQCFNNSATTTTPTSYLIDQNVWYSATISNSVPSGTVTFSLYSEAGSQLWSSSVTSGIPTGSARVYGFGLTSISTNTLVGNVLDIDRAEFGIARHLTR